MSWKDEVDTGVAVVAASHFITIRIPYQYARPDNLHGLLHCCERPRSFWFPQHEILYQLHWLTILSYFPLSLLGTFRLTNPLLRRRSNLLKLEGIGHV